MSDEQGNESSGFKRGVGNWLGTAEVYFGNGRFAGNGVDRRTVQPDGENRVRIDLSFTGPLTLSGHYVIETRGHERFYRGPVNVGSAETLDEGLVDANNYWSAWGLSQRFFLYVTKDQQQQFSLSLLTRGEQLMYTIIGEYQRIETTDGNLPTRIPETLALPGIPPDRANDPTNGRGEILLHRTGTWSGEISTLDGSLKQTGKIAYSQKVSRSDNTSLKMAFDGNGFNIAPHSITINTNQWQAWTPSGDVVGSYNLVGGRAMSGQFHHLNKDLRIWRREVVRSDGTRKVILHNVYRGGQRIGVQYGILHFEPS